MAKHIHCGNCHCGGSSGPVSALQSHFILPHYPDCGRVFINQNSLFLSNPLLTWSNIYLLLTYSPSAASSYLAKRGFPSKTYPSYFLRRKQLRKAVTVVKESLSLFVYYQDGGKSRVDIWVMNEYGAAESWTEHFSFNRDFLCSLGVMENGEVVLQDYDGELFSYDPRAQQIKDLQFPGPRGLEFVFTYYIESLVLLNEGN